MVVWKNDDELFALMRETLYSSVIGDILDKMNYLHQFLPWRIQPMRENMVVAGRAMTVLEADALETVSEGQNPIMRQSFGLMLEALDDLKKNEVYICTGSSPTYALVGELMCTRMKILGAAGAVVNGFHRDTNGILDLDFPCFSYGRYAQDQGPRGKVIDYRVPIDFFALCFPAPGCPAGQHQACLGDREAHLLGAYCSAETGDDFHAYHVGKDCGRQSGGVGVNQKEQGLV